MGQDFGPRLTDWQGSRLEGHARGCQGDRDATGRGVISPRRSGDRPVSHRLCTVFGDYAPVGHGM